MAIFLTLLFGLIFVDADYASYSGLNSGVGMVFVAALFQGMMTFQSVLPLVCVERASFYRERASQTYNALWYFLGSTLAELPYCFFSGALFTVVYYPFVGFSGFGKGVLFWLAISLTILMQVYMGMMFAYALPSEDVAGFDSNTCDQDARNHKLRLQVDRQTCRLRDRSTRTINNNIAVFAAN
ncbi:hypothetical protein PR002_g18141 [Phytophthora rubi]|uniref:ABC-2 type transporter transmembrane domain-containing protein n=1 Tax=Phytophthora rubi TaxID=129364 RepID=A0A6A3K4V4_9STRA|nr:hypothetical protein PR002_g18141 [Phytophthora rubi]